MNMMPSAIKTTPPKGMHMELRKARRYCLSAPAVYYWRGADGTLQEAQGTTRDISDRGAFILAKELPPVGKHVELQVHLSAVSGSDRTVQLLGEGTVVRTSGQEAEVSGFAAAVLFHTER